MLKKPKEIIITPYTQLRWISIPTCSFLLLFPVFVGGQESLTLLEGININYIPQTRSSGCCITCRQICFWLVGFYFHCHWTKLLKKHKSAASDSLWPISSSHSFRLKQVVHFHLRVSFIIHRFSFIFDCWVFQGCSRHSQGSMFITFCHSSSFHAESHLNIRTRGLWNTAMLTFEGWNQQLSLVYFDNLFRFFLPARTSWFPFSSSSQSKALPISVMISALMCVGRVCVSGGCVK